MSKYSDSPGRQALIHQVLGVRTLPEIVDATQALRRWVEAHPDDLGIIDGFEVLATMQECAGAANQEKGCLSASREAVPTGPAA